LWQKCSTLVGLASAPNLSRAERDKIVAGAIGVRNDIASKAENTSAGKRVFMHSLNRRADAQFGNFSRRHGCKLPRRSTGRLALFPLADRERSKLADVRGCQS